MREEFVDGIGLVRMTKDGRAVKNYNFRLKPDGSIFVSIPPGGSYKQALKTVLQLKDKIVRKQKQLEKKQAKPVLYEVNKNYRSRLFHIHIASSKDSSGTMSSEGEDVFIRVPGNLPADSDEVQEFIRACIKEVWRFEAKQIIPRRVAELAEKHKFSYRQVKINSATTRWGSCSNINNLNFSLYLMNIPEELCDYIILHELCHTVHKNHGTKFHALLDHVTEGKHKELNQTLKNFKPGF